MTDKLDQKNIGRMEKAIETLEKTCSSLNENVQENTRNTIELTATMRDLTKVVEKHVANDEKFHNETDIRLGSLENTRTQAIGWASGAGGAVGLITALATKFLGGHG